MLESRFQEFRSLNAARRKSPCQRFCEQMNGRQKASSGILNYEGPPRFFDSHGNSFTRFCRIVFLAFLRTTVVVEPGAGLWRDVLVRALPNPASKRTPITLPLNSESVLHSLASVPDLLGGQNISTGRTYAQLGWH